MRIYRGRGLMETTLRMLFLAAALMIFVILFSYGVGLLAGKGSIADVRDALANSDSFDITLIMMCSFQVSSVCAMTFERSYPGGKFFRTVKGGFDTYRKVRTALNLEALMLIAAYYGIAAIGISCSAIGIHHGLRTCAVGALCTVLAVAAANFCVMIKKNSRRTLSMMFCFFVLPVCGYLLFSAAGGRIGAAYYAVLVLAIALFFISNSVSLSYCKKHRWNN